ncbi:MAG: GNAT family N-acetyltransferase [Candidatus Thermoplasmatota archaeon]|nr:GNAT family N-acetyltransferase [Candidatus Thermoplasmatota archaeon]MBU1940507.1 GNAT family N-acetyltransferase [Candidatus Thermoplasmatota archaeon]
MNTITVRLVTDWPIPDIVSLYQAGNWWRPQYDPAKIPQLIKQSYAFAIAEDTTQKKAVGMGRVISDGISDAYIQDMIVLPTYRCKGIGKQILDILISHCLKNGITWIGLIAEPGSEQFYQTLGFITMQNHTPYLYSKRSGNDQSK